MKKLRKVLCLTFILAFAAGSVVFARSQPPPPRAKGRAQQQQQQQGQGILVGRISHVEGDLLHYVPEEQDWVVTVKDAPFGLEDALYSDENVKAEFIMPNATWVRIGASTQVQMIRLEDDITEIDTASGIARFYNKSSSAVYKVTTPYGYVMAPAQTIFDLYVGDESLEIVAIKGSVDFVHIAGDTRYEVVTGEASILADGQQVASGEGTVDEDWDVWNTERDTIWAKRVEVRGDSVRYLPEQLHDESYVLDEQGSWEDIETEDGRTRAWRPARVEADWTPYSRGHWVDWNEEQTWVPEEEEFGYVTHHYGSWVNANAGWYWAPPVVPILPVVSVGIPVAPVIGIGFGWWPGRVGWIHSDVEVGWFPLGWREPWYGRRYWGAGAVVVNNININRINVNINNFRYARHAVIVNQNNFFARNYNNVRVTNINRNTIINNYRGAPIVNDRVVRNFNTNKNRFNYTDRVAHNKPHNETVNRINRNKNLAQQDRNLKGRNLEQNVNRLNKGQLASADRIKQPKASNKMVPAGDVRKPKSDVRFGQKDLKAKSNKPKAPHELATGKPGVGRTPQVDRTGKGKAGRGGEPGAMGGEGPRGKGKVRGGRGEPLGAMGGEGPRGKGKVRGEDTLGGPRGSRGGQPGAVGGEGTRGKGKGKGKTRDDDTLGGPRGGRGGHPGEVGGQPRGGRGGDAVGGSRGGRGGQPGAVGSEGTRGKGRGKTRGDDAMGGPRGGRGGQPGEVGGQPRGGRGGQPGAVGGGQPRGGRGGQPGEVGGQPRGGRGGQPGAVGGQPRGGRGGQPGAVGGGQPRGGGKQPGAVGGGQPRGGGRQPGAVGGGQPRGGGGQPKAPQGGQQPKGKGKRDRQE
jgi:hypothetical protein